MQSKGLGPPCLEPLVSRQPPTFKSGLGSSRRGATFALGPVPYVPVGSYHFISGPLGPGCHPLTSQSSCDHSWCAQACLALVGLQSRSRVGTCFGGQGTGCWLLCPLLPLLSPTPHTGRRGSRFSGWMTLMHLASFPVWPQVRLLRGLGTVGLGSCCKEGRTLGRFGSGGPTLSHGTRRLPGPGEPKGGQLGIEPRPPPCAGAISTRMPSVTHRGH